MGTTSIIKNQEEPTTVDSDSACSIVDIVTGTTKNSNNNCQKTKPSSSQRKAKATPSNQSTSIANTNIHKSKKAKQKEDTSLEFIWICTECQEAECITHPDSPLLVCEGPCQRPFHYPCAGLPAIPNENEIWKCHDCARQNHKCCVCHEYGDDGVDVHKCEKKDCGLFYHEACLNMYDVDVFIETSVVDHVKDEELDEDDKEEHKEMENNQEQELFEHDDENDGIQNKKKTKLLSIPKFTCPAHSCWTCSGGPPLDVNDNNNNAIDESSSSVVTATTTMTEEEAQTAVLGGTVTTTNNANKSIKKKQQQGKHKRGKKRIFDNAFSEKKEKRLFRCLNCPISYHISCIPPSSKFHELALLCHEHASTSKLPYLDVANSCQKDIEDRADRMIKAAQSKKKSSIESKEGDSLVSKKRLKFMQSNNEYNPFLLGKKFLHGDAMTAYEKAIVDMLLDNEDIQENGCSNKKLLSSFCLPCGIQQEVYSRPPVYTHIHTNRYDPNYRPKRHSPTGEVCQCKNMCDEHCMNRISGVECVGDIMKKNGNKNSYWNCNCGPHCGNRMLSLKKFAKCRPKREHGKGWGLVTLNGVKKGDLVQEYVGEIIDEKTKRNRLDNWSNDHPNDPNFYIMHLESGWYIDAREMGNLSRFINHSCEPNCHLLPVNVSGHMRVAVVASRNIQPGETLNYDYHFDTQDGDKFVCRCGAKKCRGTMKGGQLVEEDEIDKKLNKSERWIVARAKLDRDKKFLEDTKKGESLRLNQVSATLPGEKPNASNIIASGPDLAIAEKGRQYNVCLKRNVIAGSNLSSRYWRLKSCSNK